MMDNISFIMPMGEIRRLERFTQESGTMKYGGLIIVAFRNDERILTGIRVFLALWDTSAGRGAAQLLIAGAGETEDLTTPVRAPYRPASETTDMELVMALRSENRPSDSYFSPEDFVNTNLDTVIAPFDQQAPDYYFDLAFIDKVTYEYMIDSKRFYYLNAGDNRYYRSDQRERSGFPNEEHLIIDENRGVKISSALSTFRHGVVGMEDPAVFTTVIVRPEPEPLIVETNHSGAVAYDIMPTCPPYWKPDAQFIDSILFLSKNAAAQLEIIKGDTPLPPSCLGTFIWIGIAIISLLYAL